ncbi:hypothetical protein DP030_20945 [Escherichia coli O106]|nr:hypothetical protein [Escherichia coli O106]TGH39712.1 hypothetical protein E5S57_21195 [Escherichia coli]
MKTCLLSEAGRRAGLRSLRGKIHSVAVYLSKSKRFTLNFISGPQRVNLLTFANGRVNNELQWIAICL